MISVTQPIPLGARTKRRRMRDASSLWLAVPLVLAVGVRGDTRDTSTYIDIFRSTIQFPANLLDYYAEFGVEWGFGLLSWLLGGMGLGPTTLFVIVSAATFFFIERTAHRLGITFYAVMPYYLGSFFLTQQLMQIRQGLGVAFAFWVLVRFALSTSGPVRLAMGAGAASLIHMVAVIPLLGASLVRLTLPAPQQWRIVSWAVVLIAVSIVLAHAVSTLQVFGLFERLSIYAADEEYSSARGLFDLANVRAVLVLALFLSACTARSLARSRVFLLLLGLYAAHVGIRLGFIDFQILSGRLSTALGFAEVFLLPMTVHACIRPRALRMLLGAAYLFVHGFATLAVQAPFLIDDYFTPLHADYAAR